MKNTNWVYSVDILAWRNRETGELSETAPEEVIKDSKRKKEGKS